MSFAGLLWPSVCRTRRCGQRQRSDARVCEGAPTVAIPWWQGSATTRPGDRDRGGAQENCMFQRFIQPVVVSFALLLSTAAFAQPYGAPAPSTQPSMTQPSKTDLNTASEKELNRLPGIGSVTARKIIAGRPYSSVSDLSRAGVSKRQIDQIASLVTVGPSPMGSPSTGSANRAGQPAPMTGTQPATPMPGAQPTSPMTGVQPTAPMTTTPGPGMVWVNTDTKVYHRQGDRFYGKTKHGKYMTESEAIQAGFRAAKK